MGVKNPLGDTKAGHFHDNFNASKEMSLISQKYALEMATAAVSILEVGSHQLNSSANDRRESTLRWKHK